ncbi:MAG: alpha/beta hydrolase [Brevefilum sp.]
MIWDFEKLIFRRLKLWAFPSILAGAGLILFGDPLWRSIGIQALAWGGADGLIAWIGLLRLRHKTGKATSFTEEEQEAFRLRKILWLKSALNVLFVAGGAALVYFLGTESLFWRGTGWGIIIQGTFLYLFDMMHALRVPEPLQLPHLPLFTHPNHASFLFEGGKQAALLVHGFPGTALEMRPLGEKLNSAGWTVSGLRLPGFGRELANLIEYGNQDWLKAVLENCQSLHAMGHEPLLLVGYSFGGALALQAAAQTKIDGLVLIAPFIWQEPAWGKALGDFFRTLLPVSIKPFRHIPLNHPALDEHYQQYLPEIDLDDPEQLEELTHFQFPMAVLDQLREVGKAGLRAAKDVQTPTLVIHSSKDQIIQSRSIEHLHTRLAGPVVRETINGPHGMTMPQHPAFKEVAAKASVFAAQILKNASPGD